MLLNKIKELTNDGYKIEFGIDFYNQSYTIRLFKDHYTKITMCNYVWFDDEELVVEIIDSMVKEFELERQYKHK